MLIIKSNQQNWEGKGFSKQLPAKVYMSFDDAVTALKSYHFWEYKENGEIVEAEKTQKLEFIFLKDEQIQDLIAQGKIRF